MKEPCTLAVSAARSNSMGGALCLEVVYHSTTPQYTMQMTKPSALKERACGSFRSRRKYSMAPATPKKPVMAMISQVFCHCKKATVSSVHSESVLNKRDAKTRRLLGAVVGDAAAVSDMRRVGVRHLEPIPPGRAMRFRIWLSSPPR